MFFDFTGGAAERAGLHAGDTILKVIEIFFAIQNSIMMTYLLSSIIFSNQRAL